MTGLLAGLARLAWSIVLLGLVVLALDMAAGAGSAGAALVAVAAAAIVLYAALRVGGRRR